MGRLQPVTALRSVRSVLLANFLSSQAQHVLPSGKPIPTHLSMNHLLNGKE
jgi:hypothetical protein